MRLIRWFTVLLIAAVLAGCQPDLPLPTSVTSNDSIGGITLNIPSGWTVFAEKSPIEGRQGVTLVRFPQNQPQDVNIDTYPVIRVGYEPRSATSLPLNDSLEAAAIRQAELLAPRATFAEPTTILLGNRPAVTMRGQTPGSDRTYSFLFVDFKAENGLVTLVLTGHGDSSALEPELQTIASTIHLTIKPDFVVPTATPAPESTAQVSPENTSESIPPESTADVSATDEIKVEGTQEVTGTGAADVTAVPGATIAPGETSVLQPETTAEIVPTATASTDVAINTPSGDVTSRTLTLINGFTLVTPENWKSTTNDANFVGLILGDDVEKAILDRKTIPSGQASISIELGSAADLFSKDANRVDLHQRLEQQITATASYRPPLTYQDIKDFTIHGQSAASVLASREISDQYTLLINLGAGMYAQIQLTSAPGEAEQLIPTVLEVAATLAPAAQ